MDPSLLRSRSGCFRRRPAANHLMVPVENSRLVGALPTQKFIEPGSTDAISLHFCNHEGSLTRRCDATMPPMCD